jgi:hypothetical protein
VTTLSDRYVAAVLRSVPERARTDIDRELRASIGDAIDARLARGESREDAEVAVLTELGDPTRLAGEYSGPPQYLIGPSVYHSYIRTLGIVLAFFVPVSWSLVVAVWVAGGDSLPSAIFTASLAATFVALLVGFMTTAGYAVVDRSAEVRREMAAAMGMEPGTWTPECLPASASVRPVSVSDAVEAIVGGTIGIALIFIQRSVSPFSDAEGQAIPFLNPDLWSFWMPILVAIAVTWILAEFAMLALGTWNAGLALAISLISLASATVYIYLLATGQLFNPAFFEKLGMAPWVAAGSIPMLILMLLAVVDTGTRTAKLWGAPIAQGRPQRPPKP